MNLPVSPSLRALLAGSVDYAGLFPPAGLELKPALENQAAYVRGDDAWMLGCFVLPTAKLPEARRLLPGWFDRAHALRISALLPKAKSADEFLNSLRASLPELARFRRAYGASVQIDQLEAPLPPDHVPAPASFHVLLQEAAGLIETLLPGPLRAYWEIPFTEELPAMLRGLAEHNAEAAHPFAVKLRTGGTEAAAFPTTGQLAGALLAARDAGVAVKFTAGLHHPVRHFNEALRTRMHGFLNVFTAGILAREHRLEAEQIQAILEDEQPESFRFDDPSVAWRERSVSATALAAHRAFVTSFGSCSFDEPRDDLRRLGLLV